VGRKRKEGVRWGDNRGGRYEGGVVGEKRLGWSRGESRGVGVRTGSRVAFRWHDDLQVRARRQNRPPMT